MSKNAPTEIADNARIETDMTSSNSSSKTGKSNIRVIRWVELQQKIGGSSLTTVTRAEKAGKFPKRIRQGSLVGWLEHEIDEYLLSLPRGTRYE